MVKANIFWFRRDLRLYDNHGLSIATSKKLKVIPIFIFDIDIIDDLSPNDNRINFIYNNLVKLDSELNKNYDSSLSVFKGRPIEIFKQILTNYNIGTVFTNNDYEPYSIIYFSFNFFANSACR